METAWSSIVPALHLPQLLQVRPDFALGGENTCRCPLQLGLRYNKTTNLRSPSLRTFATLRLEHPLFSPNH